MKRHLRAVKSVATAGLLALLLCPLSSAAQSGPGQPFYPGETLVFNFYWSIIPTGSGSLKVLYEDINGFGGRKEAEHDLVVLSVGVQPNAEPFTLFAGENLTPDPFGYVKEVEEEINPGKTSIEGVFAAGTASGSRDIPDTVLHAGAAAAQAAAYIEQRRAGR
jgi:heterodisulfide reductase subunit A-like polyferredoxin